jgi:hypothetical protein
MNENRENFYSHYISVIFRVTAMKISNLTQLSYFQTEGLGRYIITHFPFTTCIYLIQHRLLRKHHANRSTTDAGVFTAMGRCLPACCLAMAVCSGSTNPAWGGGRKLAQGSHKSFIFSKRKGKLYVTNTFITSNFSLSTQNVKAKYVYTFKL